MILTDHHSSGIVPSHSKLDGSQKINILVSMELFLILKEQSRVICNKKFTVIFAVISFFIITKLPKPLDHFNLTQNCLHYCDLGHLAKKTKYY